MLDDAKQRNDVLSQAYATLHTEYVTLKTSQINDAQYSQQYDVAYGAVSGNMHLSPTGVDGYEMDPFQVYGDMTNGYTL